MDREKQLPQSEYPWETSPEGRRKKALSAADIPSAAAVLHEE